MEDFNNVFGPVVAVLGFIGGIYLVVELFTAPAAKVKMLAWALGVAVAVGIFFWPNRVLAYDGKGEVECGSAYKPKELAPDPACEKAEGILNQSLCAITREARVKECEDKRRSAIKASLMTGIGCGIMFIVNWVRWRRLMPSGGG
jgi:hypothetical protein